jgi:hypothetical protein
VSYVAIKPSYFQMLQPESAWHPGAEGWSVAPYPGWGENPALVGPKRLGVEGLGVNISVSDQACDCTADRSKAMLGGVVFGGLIVGLGAFLLTRH